MGGIQGFYDAVDLTAMEDYETELLNLTTEEKDVKETIRKINNRKSHVENNIGTKGTAKLWSAGTF